MNFSNHSQLPIVPNIWFYGHKLTACSPLAYHCTIYKCFSLLSPFAHLVTQFCLLTVLQTSLHSLKTLHSLGRLLALHVGYLELSKFVVELTMLLWLAALLWPRSYRSMLAVAFVLFLNWSSFFLEELASWSNITMIINSCSRQNQTITISVQSLNDFKKTFILFRSVNLRTCSCYELLVLMSN